MTFWREDFPALLLDFGVVVEDALGTRLRGLLQEQDVMENDGSGDVVIRATTLSVPAGTLPTLAIGDTLRTWLPDAPVSPLTWKVRNILLRQDGTPTRYILAAA